MFWSKKKKKGVEFTEEVADGTLWAAVEAELAKHPHKTFSDLCKEALWQFLYVPETARPQPARSFPAIAGGAEELIAQMQRQLDSLEQRLAAREAQPSAAVTIGSGAEGLIAQIQSQLNSLERRLAARETQPLAPVKDSAAEGLIAQMQGQLDSLEQRLAAREASRLDSLEHQMRELSIQVGQLAIALSTSNHSHSAPFSPPATTGAPSAPPAATSRDAAPPPKPETLAPPPPEDPLLRRLGSLLDDF